MHLLQALLLRRQVFQWLIPLISLWVAIVCALAFSGAAVAETEAIEPHAALPLGKAQTSSPIAIPAAFILPRSIEQEPIDPQQPSPPLVLEPATSPNIELLVIDGDPDLPAHDLLPARAAIAPPEKPLFMDGTCQTPMSLMVHSSFGTERMQQLAREIVVQGLKTTTYRAVGEVLRRGDCPSSNSLIVSLDDFGTDWLRPHFQSMIRIFTDRGLRLVVAAVVHGPQDPEAWAYLGQLEAQGNEVASHTIDHYNLARLEPDDVKRQIKGAHQIICHNLGRCPETLILPFGNNDGDGYVQEAAAGYSFIVGIPGGRAFRGEAPYYLGRIAPDNFDQRRTLHELTATFSIQPSASTVLLSLRATSGRGCAVGPSPSAAVPLALCIPSAPQAPTSDGSDGMSSAY
ncbi:MAG: polysaccharide deacetylase family protein [Anaerolineales bacterium]